jgi:hypothetical protein
MEDQVEGLTTIFTEFYYWVTVAFMFLIHAGFMLYEAGVARRKNLQHTVLKNILLIPRSRSPSTCSAGGSTARSPTALD